MAARPVLLLHGFYDTAMRLHPMRDFLTARGMNAVAIDLEPSDGRAPLAELARQVKRFADTHFPEAFDIVAFSMGGLVARYYLQRLGGMERVRRFVTLGTPHHGTWMAYLSGRPGVRDMRPHSAFLEDLNRDVGTLSALDCTSIWTPFDQMILPAVSSKMPVGKSVRVWTPAHLRLVYSERVMRHVLEALN